MNLVSPLAAGGESVGAMSKGNRFHGFLVCAGSFFSAEFDSQNAVRGAQLYAVFRTGQDGNLLFLCVLMPLLMGTSVPIG